MLEHVPQWLGTALQGVRAGADSLAIAQPELHGAATIELSSPAFGHGGRLPPRFTADGAGVSPPLVWGPAPEGTALLALLVEDADAPARSPLVHAIVWGLPADSGRLEEGAIRADGAGQALHGDVGRTSYLAEGWLPPDPPTGHGDHSYAFQLFALDAAVADPGETPGRAALLQAMAGHVLGSGLLVGTYSRGDNAAARPLGGALPA
ncbi:YbhB/YbcL family Raf kinase inhibitor-like protein [Sphingomonas qilianensis]|uniref:YbhB/YbcL family Raf kinase inhibitor-like protein n=1 Tax=Sphingomonas qilianensis TaxID=1736690 RepID=A0ABU9XWC8_9SPHN